MSNWLNELGSKKMDTKELKLVAGLFALLKEAEEGVDDEDKTEFLEMMDNAIYNITEMKKVVRENL